MDKYDPLQPPDAEVWLATNEEERHAAIAAFHRSHQPELGPGAGLHMALHMIVENQIALGDETPVQLKIRHLMAQGLDRHEAIHCVASVLIVHIHALAKSPDQLKPSDFNARYYAELKRMTARKWLRSGSR